jgi:5-formyltetrahydrofolate cyclo-ligase
MNKADLRTQYLMMRKAISPENFHKWNQTIHQNLEAFPEFAYVPCILTYVDSKDNEVETRPLISSALEQGKIVLVPRCAPNKHLEWCPIKSLDDLLKNTFGIWEPKKEISTAAIPDDSVCLVPGIVFHSQGYRIGYGGGYYDRFLAGYQGVSIGLAFEKQLYDDWQPEPYDVGVQYLVSEKGVQKCGK